jgi:hypothetical protein
MRRLLLGDLAGRGEGLLAGDLRVAVDRAGRLPGEDGTDALHALG